MVEVKPRATFVESSSDGFLTIELDAAGGVVRCQVEPEVMVAWTADVLADRVMRLHRLVLMQVRCAQRIAAWLVEIAPAFPTRQDVAEYRRTIDF
jgi:hypothetical protein